MDTKNETAPRVYVGTYAKYNAGNLAGRWVNLEDYPTAEEFGAKCREIHADEADPELMFQDFEGFPKDLYGESGLSAHLWEWLELDEDERQLWEIYGEHVIGDMTETTFDDAQDAFLGTYESPEDWAENFLTDTGALESVPDELARFIDFEAYAKDAEQGGTHFVRTKHDETWVFMSI